MSKKWDNRLKEYWADMMKFLSNHGWTEVDPRAEVIEALIDSCDDASDAQGETDKSIGKIAEEYNVPYSLVHAIDARLRKDYEQPEQGKLSKQLPCSQCGELTEFYVLNPLCEKHANQAVIQSQPEEQQRRVRVSREWVYNYIDAEWAECYTEDGPESYDVKAMFLDMLKSIGEVEVEG